MIRFVMAKFTHKNAVRMYDTDAAGILYFASQFRFIHDAFEAMMEHEGFSFKELFSKKQDFFFVIVHAESDYLTSMYIGDKLDIHAYVSRIGETSFTMSYDIFREGEHTGRASTVHVCINPKTKTKVPIPEKMKALLSKHTS